MSSATSSRTITCSRSAASMRVEPRGRSASSPRTITLRSASRGRPSSRTQLPDDRVVGPDRVLDDLRAEPAHRAGLRRAAAAAPARVVVTPSLRASHSTVVPWSSVEITTAKKTMLKNSRAVRDAVDHREGGEHDRHRAAQPRPAEHDALRDREAVQGGRDERRHGPRDEDEDAARAPCPRAATSPSSLGKTSRPSVRNIAICATHARPWWNTVTVCLAGMRPEPSISPAR